MKGGKQKSPGFTIVETLIVLSVTSLMFLAAVTYISGRQNKVQFMDAIQDIRSQILTTMSEVSSGSLRIGDGIRCVNSANNVQISVGGATNVVGSNSECVFLGKAMTFSVDGAAGSFRVDPVIGLRLQSNGQVATSLVNSRPIIANGFGGVADPVDMGQAFGLKNGLILQQMRRGNAPGTRILGFAVITSPDAQVNYGTNGLESGMVSTNVQYILDGNTATLGATRTEAFANARTQFQQPTDFQPANGIQLCFSNGSTNQSGLITIGTNNQGLTADLAIRNGLTC